MPEGNKKIVADGLDGADGSADRKMIKCNGSDVEVGKMTKEARYYQTVLEANNEMGEQIAVELIHRAASIGLTFNADLTSSPDGFEGLCWNPKEQKYFTIRVSSINPDFIDKNTLYRLVTVFFADDSQLEVTICYSRQGDGNEYRLSTPNRIVVKTDKYSIHQTHDWQRVYGQEAEDVSGAADLFTSTAPLLNTIEGYKVDYFEALYGELSDVELVREYLGGRAIIDETSGVVLERIPQKGPAYDYVLGRDVTPMIEHQLKGIVAEAKTQLRETIADRYPLHDLPRMIQEKKKI